MHLFAPAIARQSCSCLAVFFAPAMSLSSSNGYKNRWILLNPHTAPFRLICTDKGQMAVPERALFCCIVLLIKHREMSRRSTANEHAKSENGERLALSLWQLWPAIFLNRKKKKTHILQEATCDFDGNDRAVLNVALDQGSEVGSFALSLLPQQVSSTEMDVAEILKMFLLVRRYISPPIVRVI